jgi:broad specificity phosphatase PhoE
VADTTADQLTAFKGAEDPQEFAKRVLDGLKDVVDDNRLTLIVAHAGVGRVIETLRNDEDPAKFYEFEPYPNGHAVELDLSWVQ